MAMSKRKVDGLEVLKSLLENGYTLEELVAVLDELSKYSKQDIIERMTARRIQEGKKPLSMQEKVVILLQEFGMPNVLGRKYLEKAIILAYQNPELLKRKIVNGLYSMVAEEYDTTPKRVERNIYTAIQTTWKIAQNREAIRKCLPPALLPNKRKPSNGKFIGAIAQYFHLHD